MLVTNIHSLPIPRPTEVDCKYKLVLYALFSYYFFISGLENDQWDIVLGISTQHVCVCVFGVCAHSTQAH